MPKVYGVFLLLIAAVLLAYVVFNSLIFLTALDQVRCGMNPMVLAFTAGALAIGLSLGVSGVAILAPGRVALRWWLPGIWIVAGLAFVATFLLLPPCPFPAK